ncbi:MAG: Fructosamine/Ketosamine-3-kinase [Phycisphaerales bacterium]|nr:Fructosamine/Ketosamine-3-kinase [Phycisphaerales bacterium]
MPLQDSDISWQMLRRIVHDWAGTSAELIEVKYLDGGCINTTVALTTKTGERAVCKISPHRVNRQYLTEAFQLNILRTIGLPAPQVYVSRVGDLDDPISYLLMEFVEGVDLAHARRECSAEAFDHLQMHLAEQVLALHNNTHETYTRLTEGERQEFTSWADFYRNVYDTHLQACEKNAHIPIKMRKVIGRVHERLEKVLAHDDCPRLVHWDVWSTNILCKPDAHGRWWVSGLVDPNCKYAHAEAEIAYMDLFHTITPAFLRAYQQVRRLHPEYHRVRKHIYQLYELINHLNAFGPEYLKPLLGMVEKVAAVA